MSKPVSDFYKNTGRADGLSGYCALCMVKANKDSYERLKARTYETLGTVCAHCGFSDVRALQIDHIEGSGAEARRQGKKGKTLFLDVIRDSTPYQLLCANCNVIKRIENNENVGTRVYARQIPGQS